MDQHDEQPVTVDQLLDAWVDYGDDDAARDRYLDLAIRSRYDVWLEFIRNAPFTRQ